MRNRLGLVLAVLLAGGCETLLDPDERLEPRDVEARYEWVERGWADDSSRPLGQPSVVLTWSLPDEWDGEVFRVYARESGEGGYGLVATVTSCGAEACRYSDLNVRSGESYDYFVAAVDEAAEEEVESEAVRADVPAYAPPAPPTGVTARALDGAVWVRWTRAAGVQRYRVFLRQDGATATFVEVGETDGSSFLDTRVTNGRRYGYRVSAVDSLGHTGTQSTGVVLASPRPDYQAELIYATADSMAASGFRFVASETENPIVPGDAPAAQWRLERSGSQHLIAPRGGSRVTAGQFTTALTCGPGSDADCVATTTAPSTASFLDAPVVAEAGYTYLFRVTGSDGQPHYAKVRVQGRTTDSAGRGVLVFDWAYQLIANEPSLSTGAR